MTRISGEIVRVKVLSVERYPSSEKNRAYYAEKEALDVENEGGQKYKLTRFRRKSENRIVKGYVYQGEQTQSKDPEKYPIDTFENVEYIEGGFGGVASEDWPLPDNDEMDEREIILRTQSNLHTAAPFVAAELTFLKSGFENQKQQDDWLIRWLKHYAKLADRVGEELVIEYKKEQESK